MTRAIAIAALFSLSLAHANDERRNPFAHTLQESVGSDITVEENVAVEELRLTAILVAGDASLVTLNGNVIGLGEEALGHTLISVTEESAAFLRNGDVVRLSLFDSNEPRNPRD